MVGVSEWKRRLLKLGYPESKRAERRIPSGFAARRGNDPAAKPATIHDLSASGLYLLTEERWPLGELVPLTVHVEGTHLIGTVPSGPEPELGVQARVIRHGPDGVGFSFVLPEGLDQNLWEVLMRNAVALTDAKTVWFTLKMLRTVLFLCRLCHAEAHDAIVLLGGELDEQRTETAFEIVFGTEELLAKEPGGDTLRADPKLVTSLVKFGSWAIDDLTKQLWMGLFATSCTAEGTDDSNQAFVDLLVNVTPTQSLIFVAACNKAMETMRENEDLPSTRVIFTPQEMMQLTGRTDISRIATDIAYLFNAELVEKNFDFTSYLPAEDFDITPAQLGLELYKRCKGHLAKAHTPVAESLGTQASPQF